jgi:hypothetical protein
MNQFQLFTAWVGKFNIGSLIPLALGMWGMVDQYTKNRKTFIMLFVTMVVVSLGLISFLNFSDAEVRERDYFYSPAFYYFAIYIGIGAASLLNELRGAFERQRANPVPVLYGLAVVLLILPVFTLKTHYFTHDRSNNYTCPVYARNMLIGLEKDAIIFTNGDNDTFPLWYIQEVEGFRTDVKVVNLSLLQTPWYIIQCKHNEPKTPITWTDEQIYRLTPVPTQDGWLMVRDLAVQHILRANEWKRPIYFAVTVPRTTFEPYLDILEFEGLAHKFVRRKGRNMFNVEKTIDAIYNKYDYTSILDENWKRDESVYLPPHTEHLIQNYAAAFVQLALQQHRDSLYAESVKALEIANEIAPAYPPPLQLLGWYYLDMGDTTKAIQFYQDQLARQPNNIELRFRLAGVYERTGQNLAALEQLEYLIRLDPDSRDAVMAATGIALRADQIAKARQILAGWLRLHPEDLGAKGALDDLDRQTQGGSTP